MIPNDSTWTFRFNFKIGKNIAVLLNISIKNRQKLIDRIKTFRFSPYNYLVYNNYTINIIYLSFAKRIINSFFQY